MTRIAKIFISCLSLGVFLAGWQPASAQDKSWVTYLDEVARMQPEEMLAARAAAVQAYTEEPTDVNRLKAGYALSRTPASIEQLARGRYILAEISDNSVLAPMRDLLVGEISRYLELQGVELSVRRLHAENDALQSKLSQMQKQLDERNLQLEAQQEQLDKQEKQLATLKKIEGDMVESQEEADEMDP